MLTVGSLNTALLGEDLTLLDAHLDDLPEDLKDSLNRLIATSDILLYYLQQDSEVQLHETDREPTDGHFVKVLAWTAQPTLVEKS